MSFAASVPDLGRLGGQLCVRVESTPGFSQTEVCGLSAGQSHTTVTLQAPPSLLTPTSGTPIGPSTGFAWTPYANGVHLLEIESIVPSPAAPSIYVLTSAAATPLPDLAPLGLAFPNGADYKVTVAGLGPYPGLDEALSADGLGALFPAEIRQSYSETLYTNEMP